MKKNKKALALQMVTVLTAILLTSTGSWAESYTSFDSKYPDFFDNTVPDTKHNDLLEMDAVNCQGYEFIFFTLHSDVGDNGAYLYWYIPGTNYRGKVDIGNSDLLNFRIKASVFNNVIYIFYTPAYFGDPDHPNTSIYYRTCELNIDPVTKIMTPLFSDEKGIATGLSPTNVLFAAEMNGKLFVHFASWNHWYYTSSVDGLTFVEESYVGYAGEGIYGPGATVFPVVNDEGEMEDRMMVAYCPENDNYIKYWFFDGERVYGIHSLTGINNPRAVRLFAGGADGYDNSRFSIQVFISAPEDGTSKKWADLMHIEYIPSGIDGDEGSWVSPLVFPFYPSPVFSYLQNDDDDNPNCYNDYGSDQRWAVIPVYTEEHRDTDDQTNLRTSLRIWYAKGTDFVMYPNASDVAVDYVKFRASTYKSDLLEYVDTQTTEPYELDDPSAAIVVGILEGTPPFPMNNGGLGDVNTNTSTLMLGTSENTDVTTNYTIGGGTGISFGRTKEKVYSWQAKLTTGLKYTYTDTTSHSSSISETYKTYTNVPPGNLGWALVFRPEIIADQYVLNSYDGHTLAYESDDSGDATYLYVINYGPGSNIVPIAYYLDDPSYPISDYAGILEGMKERPLSSDFDGWLDVEKEYNSADPSFSHKELPMNNLLHSTQGETTNIVLSTGETTGQTYSTNVSVSFSANKLGFTNVGFDANISWSMDWSSKTTVTNNLGFWLNIPECCDPRDPDCSTSCISNVDELPILLTPAEDDTGYDAPWISTDIRAYRKPKPWCLSYRVYGQYNTAADIQRLTVSKAWATLHLDRKKPNRDSMEAKLTLDGLAGDFSLQESAPLHLRIGNYVLNSDSANILSRGLKGGKLVLEFTEASNPEASVRVTITHDKARSLLLVDVKGQRLDLSRIAPTLLDDEFSGRRTGTLPFVFLLDGSHMAEGELDVHVTANG